VLAGLLAQKGFTSSLDFVEGKAVVRFDHVGAGLAARDGPLVGFTIAGADQKFHPAVATIQGDSVRVTGAKRDDLQAAMAWSGNHVASDADTEDRLKRFGHGER
ncbi:MAG: DUF520 family protein, partial [Betaproteobacteria bacterium]|nr:DUF520 family protein [Betaproteobacteria bacterium]